MAPRPARFWQWCFWAQSLLCQASASDASSCAVSHRINLIIMILNRVKLSVLVLGCSLATALAQPKSLSLPPIAEGPFKPDWNSLTNYQTPEWFRDAKFGIWAHWGPQCQPEHGDWYARSMYEEGSGNYKSHIVDHVLEAVG